jgi:hypothetical protein
MRVQCTASHLVFDEGVTYRKGDVFEIREEDFPRVRTAVKVLPDLVPTPPPDPVPVEPVVGPVEPVPDPKPKTTAKRKSRAK